MFKKKLTLVLAVMVLGASLLMAGAAAWQRSETPLDRALLVVLSCVTVSAVHLLPSLTKSRAMWPLWAGCFMLAVYGHAGFFSFASTRANEARAEQSQHTLALKSQQARVRETLQSITARPLASVAGQLSRTTDQNRREALAVELNEAKRAAELRDSLLRIEVELGSNVATVDPVMRQLSAVTGANTQTVALIFNLGAAALVEVLGAVLWVQLIATENKAICAAGDTDAQSKPPMQSSGVDALRSAVSEGRCRATVKGVREFMGCSQAKAMELRRQLIA
jgi:hypothetical protein